MEYVRCRILLVSGGLCQRKIGHEGYCSLARDQSQASLTDQLQELVQLANQNGLYDAADYLNNILDKK
jgi:hypothetical protein